MNDVAAGTTCSAAYSEPPCWKCRYFHKKDWNMECLKLGIKLENGHAMMCHSLSCGRHKPPKVTPLGEAVKSYKFWRKYGKGRWASFMEALMTWKWTK